MATAESEFGTILVDQEGLSLYMFIPDAQGEPTCEGDSAAAWPAFLGTATAGEGVDESLITSVPRADGGGDQVSYNDWPLYYFAEDSAAGDVNGQGVGDVWYLMSPDGEPIEESATTDDAGPPRLAGAAVVRRTHQAHGSRLIPLMKKLCR